MRLFFTTTCLCLAIMTVGCNQSASSNSALDKNQSTQTVDRAKTDQSSTTSSSKMDDSPQETKIAQADPSTKSQSATILDGQYILGHTGQGLQVEGDRYRYNDEEGNKPWRSITELTAIKEGVIYDGDAHWCLNTMKPRDKIGVCTKAGWVIDPPPVNNSASLNIPALEKEMSYEQARQLIINAGWQPLLTTTDNPHDGTKSWRDRGYNEVEACSGTGMGFCRFQFTGTGKQKLVVVTGGRGATLQKWWEESAEVSNTRETSNLPFVGKRYFNFLGGSGTGYTITIESNGNTVIQQHGTMQSSTLYQGPFQETMTMQDGQSLTIKDGYAGSCDPEKSGSEEESAPCKAKLYE